MAMMRSNSTIPEHIVEALFRTRGAKVLGEGVAGKTKRVRVTPILRSTLNLPPYLILKEFKGSHRESSKTHEEKTHLLIYKRMTAACRRRVCQPIRTAHPFISVQVSASQSSRDSSESLLQYLNSHTRVHPDVVRELAKCLRCLHNAGCVHNDIKFDNLLVVHDQQPPSVKLIDFGLSTCYRTKLKLRPQNLNKVAALTRNLSNDLSNENIRRLASPNNKGYFLNSLWVTSQRPTHRPMLKRNEQALEDIEFLRKKAGITVSDVYLR